MQNEFEGENKDGFKIMLDVHEKKLSEAQAVKALQAAGEHVSL